mmetsp:Transcript_53742/g.126656  ORF Transcript_53742/g.126656 Transcript_53742/m.126656 type:complete len:295 (+) Transcript_53742:1791-2675(+)
MVVQPRAQAAPGDVAVAVLAAAVLALHDDAGRDVRQAHRRVGLVDVLAAGAAGAEGVGTHIGRVDVDLDRVVHFRVDEQRRERGVAAAGAVERALAHQAVHAGLGAQQAEGVLALHLDRRALDAGHVAGRFVFQRGLEALALAVLQVLAQQHAGPVAGLGAAGAGLDVDEAVARVGRVVEHPAEFQLLDLGLQRLGVFLDRQHAGLVAVFAAHREEFGVVGQRGGQVLDGVDHRFELALFLAELLGALGVVPDVGVLQRGVDFVQAQGLAVEVKDTPLARRCALRGRPGCCRFG